MREKAPRAHRVRVGGDAGLVANATQHYRIPLTERLELIAYDARLRLTVPRGIDDRTVIVDIDEDSLAAEGRWPWRRDKLAKLVDRLFVHYHAGIVGFDVVFGEPDEISGLGILRDLADGELRANAQFQQVLERLTRRLKYDRLFADRLVNRPVLLGFYFSDVRGEDGTGRRRFYRVMQTKTIGFARATTRASSGSTRARSVFQWTIW